MFGGCWLTHSRQWLFQALEINLWGLVLKPDPLLCQGMNQEALLSPGLGCGLLGATGSGRTGQSCVHESLLCEG